MIFASDYQEVKLQGADFTDEKHPSHELPSSETSDDDFPIHYHPQRNRSWLWKLSTLVLATLFAASMFFHWTAYTGTSSSYEKGFTTDMQSAIGTIEMVQTKFTGGLTFNETGGLIRDVPPGAVDWAGPPTDESDALWDRLVQAGGLYLQGKDADDVRGKTQFYEGYWSTGLDVFHQIHCLNRLRQAFYPERYPETDGPRARQLHTEHCIDYLRQSILCSSDISPINVLWFESAGRYAPDFNSVHTCRNFETILAWSEERMDVDGWGKEVGVMHVDKTSTDHPHSGLHHQKHAEEHA